MRQERTTDDSSASAAKTSTVTGLAFAITFVLTSAGFAQAAGLADIAGLLQRLTLTIGWAWLTLLAVHLLKAPSAAPRTERT